MPNNAILALQQQRLLLEIEYCAEREAYRRQTESVGSEAGRCLVPHPRRTVLL